MSIGKISSILSILLLIKPVQFKLRAGPVFEMKSYRIYAVCGETQRETSYVGMLLLQRHTLVEAVLDQLLACFDAFLALNLAP